jgi:hypothetical protein
MLLRFTVRDGESPPLPAVDLAVPAAGLVIGSAPTAGLRLPARGAAAEHVRIEGAAPGWRAVAAVEVDGVVRAPGERGPIGAGVALAIGQLHVRVEGAPSGSTPAPPARTASLARELVRGLLGAGAQPSLVIEAGAAAGASRALAPPESQLVIGRGDDADWVILDDELSRLHAVVRRGWDRVTVRDLGSKNGTRVDGVPLGALEGELRDGAELALGGVRARFRDPAEAHLRGDRELARAAPAGAGAPPTAPERAAARIGPRAAAGPARAVGDPAAAPALGGGAGIPWLAAAAAALALAALAALAWILGS